MDAIFKWAGENNFHKIFAGVTKENTRAMKFYINYGFLLTGDSTQKDENCIRLVKKVN